MPSYKDKAVRSQLALDDMDRRVLLTETQLRSLRDDVRALIDSADARSERSRPDPMILTQFIVAIREVEELMEGEATISPADAGRDINDLMTRVTDVLHQTAKTLRESQVRAEAILEEFVLPAPTKLMKRERREEMRKASISSIAASLAQSRVTSPDRSQGKK